MFTVELRGLAVIAIFNFAYNRSYSYPWYFTSFERRLVWGDNIKKRLMSFTFKRLTALASVASYFQSNNVNTKMAYCTSELFQKYEVI